MLMSKVRKASRFCGTCQHYCWTLSPQRKTTCNNLGSIETTPSCTDYSINPFILQDFEAALKPLADVLRVMPITTISMFLEIIGQEKQLRRRGYYFMEKIAVKYWGTPGQKYVSNYIIAHVYSATNDGIFVIGKSGIRMLVMKDSIIKLEEFFGIRRDLKESGMLLDPTLASRASNKQKLAITETLDDIIARGLVDEDDLDKDIKRKLNTKRISKGIAGDFHPTETRMSTSIKKNILDEADQFLLSAEKGLKRHEPNSDVRSKKDRRKAVSAEVLAQSSSKDRRKSTKRKVVEIPEVITKKSTTREIPSLFDNLKSKMGNKKLGGKK